MPSSRNFYPRSPCGERRYLTEFEGYSQEISIHALLAESDSKHKKNPCKTLISIHALLAESDLFSCFIIVYVKISIHALLAESDNCFSVPYRFKVTISIHALLAESDLWATCEPAGGRTFLSTLSLRRATCDILSIECCNSFLSTLSLRRATLNLPSRPIDKNISIHALLAESDNLRVVDGSKSSIISIHALLAESDVMHALKFANAVLFLSTLSLRRATAKSTPEDA